jgi:Protein of unknown function (DUF2892)
MTRNMSNIDRSIRVTFAIIFAYLYFSGLVTGALGIALMAFGAIFVLTSIVSYCPLYRVFHFNSFKR